MKQVGNPIVIDLIVPVYNESDQMIPHIENMIKVVRGAGYIPHIILVDDGSVDDTWHKISQLSTKHEEIEGIRLSRNFGKDQAILRGLKYSHGNAAITIDSDGQHPIAMLPAMIQKWCEGNLIVNAIKVQRLGETIWAKFRAKIFNHIISKLMDLSLAGICDYKVLDRKIVEILQKNSNSNSVYRFLIAELGFPSASVSIESLPSSRSSRWSSIKLFELSVRVLIFHTDLPIKALSLLIIFVFFLTIIVFLLLIASFFYTSVPKGYSTTIVLTLLNLCITMIGIMGLAVYMKGAFDILSRRTPIEWETTFEEGPLK